MPPRNLNAHKFIFYGCQFTIYSCAEFQQMRWSIGLILAFQNAINEGKSCIDLKEEKSHKEHTLQFSKLIEFDILSH